MILRLLIAIIIIALAFFLIRRLRQHKQIKTKQVSQFEETVSCKECGLRLPKPEAIEKDDEFYCCQEHAKK